MTGWGNCHIVFNISLHGMSVLYDLEEDFIIRDSNVSTIRPLIENWLNFNDFSLRQTTPPHMIMADRKRSKRVMRPHMRLFQISFNEKEGNITLSVKIRGYRRRDKYDYWTILVRLFKDLHKVTKNKSVDEVVEYLMNDEYEQYLKDTGKILLK